MVRPWWRNGAKIELLHSVLTTRQPLVWGLSRFSKQFDKMPSRKLAFNEVCEVWWRSYLLLLLQ